MALNLEHIHRIHCIGIGGIGVSAVAKFFRLEGKEVIGSDSNRSEVTEDAEEVGVIVKDEDAENISPDLDLVIYTSAAKEDHPERKAAAAFGIPQLSYFECLGLLSKGYETIAVAGTNGKSTTTAMLGQLLEAGGLDPVVIVGSRSKKFPYGNLRKGKGKYFVVEACEHEAQMLHLEPKHVVVTNITEDHLDFYRDIDHIRETFQKLVKKMPEDGWLVLNDDDAVSKKLEPQGRVVTYGFRDGADYRAEGAIVKNKRQEFTITRKDPAETWKDMSLVVPGYFNIQNALAAAAMARELGVNEEVVSASLASFDGLWRRFERVGEFRGAPVISDYGHHPDAIRATLQAAREFFPGRRIVLAFQPHHHHRTKELFPGFVDSLKDADLLILEEIYRVSGRSVGEGEVSSKDLSEAIKEKKKAEVWYAEDNDGVLEKLKNLAEPGDVILIMGAGSIYRVVKKLV